MSRSARQSPPRPDKGRFPAAEDGKPQTFRPSPWSTSDDSDQSPISPRAVIASDVALTRNRSRADLCRDDRRLHTPPDQSQRLKAAARRFVNKISARTISGCHPHCRFPGRKSAIHERQNAAPGCDRQDERPRAGVADVKQEQRLCTARLGGQQAEEPYAFDAEQARDARATFGAYRGSRPARGTWEPAESHPVLQRWHRLQRRERGAESAAHRLEKRRIPAPRHPPTGSRQPLWLRCVLPSTQQRETMSPSTASTPAVDPIMATTSNPRDVYSPSLGDENRSGRIASAPGRKDGGFAVVDRNDFAAGYQRSSRESSYYVLAYYPRPGTVMVSSTKSRFGSTVPE